LHGPLNTQTEYALRGLLLESEKELAKLLATNGNRVPFDGEIAQILTLTHGRGQLEVPDSPVSQQSEFVFIAAPGSSLPDLHTNKEAPATLNSPIDEVHSKEAICEESDCEAPLVCEEPDYEKPDCKTFSVCEEPDCEKPDYKTPPVCEESDCEKPDCEALFVCKEPDYEKPDCEALFVCEEPDCKKPDYETLPVCEESDYEKPDYEAPFICEELDYEKSNCEAPSVCKESDCEKPDCKALPDCETPPACEEPVCGEPVYDGVYGAVVMEESQPKPDEDDEWSSFSVSKKEKKGKKKGKKAIEEVEILEESIPEPGPVLSAACDPVPEAVVEQDSWLDWGMSLKKDKKKKKLRSTVPSHGGGAQAVQEESEIGLEVGQFAPLAIGIPTPAAPRSGQTVVFTIRHSNSINKVRTLEVMLFLTDTTYAAICEAVFEYLDSQEGILPSKRTLKIKSGIGRNGKVDLLAVEESMWPVYMEYFCQYTKLPELTVDVLDS